MLEHVENPALVLQTLWQVLQEGGRLFVTTVANLAAEDHIYLFRDVEEIRKMIENTGFAITSECVLPLSAYETEDYLPINYAAILTKITNDE